MLRSVIRFLLCSIECKMTEKKEGKQVEKQRYTVRVGKVLRQYEAGTTYEKISEDFQAEYENDIVLVFVDNRLQELGKKLKKDCVLKFVTTGEAIGNQTYRRSMSLLLVKAVYNVAGHENIDKVRILYSVSKGYYCKVEGNVVVNQDFLNRGDNPYAGYRRSRHTD